MNNKKRKLDFNDGFKLVSKYHKNIYSLSEELQNNKDIILHIVKNNNNGYKYVPEKLKNDRDIIFECVKKNNNVYKNISEDLKSDTEIALVALKKNITLLKLAPFIIRNNPDIILEIIKNNTNSFRYICKSLEYISDELKNNKNFILKVIEYNIYLSLIHI